MGWGWNTPESKKNKVPSLMVSTCWGVGRTEPMTPNRVLQTGTIASLPKVKGLKKTILKSGGV